MWLAIAVVGAAGGPAEADSPRVIDRVVAGVDGAAVPASDVALARALGLFGLEPARTPLAVADVERYLEGRLLVGEANRLQIESPAAERAAAWAAAAARHGGSDAFQAWLDAVHVPADWARELVDDDLRRRQFVELRFRALAFVSEAEVTAALGGGAASEAERDRERRRLEEARASDRLRAWLAEARQRATVRVLLPEGETVPLVLPGGPESRAGAARSRSAAEPLSAAIRSSIIPPAGVLGRHPGSAGGLERAGGSTD